MINDIAGLLMNITYISIEGPVEGNLARIVVGDNDDSETFHLEFPDVEQARKQGVQQLLELVIHNAGSRSFDIISAAKDNKTPIFFDYEELDVSILDAVLTSPNSSVETPSGP